MELTIRRPDDFHVHLRQGEMLRNVLPCTASVFARGLVMGNLPDPIMTSQEAMRYREQILAVWPGFKPLMTIMLTKCTTEVMIRDAFASGIRVVKYIPRGVSTNSEHGVSITDLPGFYREFALMADLGMVFSGHWEAPFDVAGNAVSEINREDAAIRFLDGIASQFPDLRIVVEHASTWAMINYVSHGSRNIAATLTVHHALLEHHHVCDEAGAVTNPWWYCKPVAKRHADMRAVRAAMTSGNPKFFFGSDSAPHPKEAKENNPPAAGIFTAPVALPLLCQIFEEEGVLSRLENFAARYGAEFYGLPKNKGTVTVRKQVWQAPKEIGGVPVFKGGEDLWWKITQVIF